MKNVHAVLHFVGNNFRVQRFACRAISASAELVIYEVTATPCWGIRGGRLKDHEPMTVCMEISFGNDRPRPLYLKSHLFSPIYTTIRDRSLCVIF